MSIATAVEIAKDLGNLLTSVPKEYADCTGIKQDIAKIKAWALNLKKNPLAIVGNIKKNWNQIGKELFEFPVDIKKGDWKDLGVNAAEFLIDIVGRPGDAAKKAKKLSKKPAKKARRARKHAADVSLMNLHHAMNSPWGYYAAPVAHHAVLQHPDAHHYGWNHFDAYAAPIVAHDNDMLAHHYNAFHQNVEMGAEELAQAQADAYHSAFEHEDFLNQEALFDHYEMPPFLY